MVRYFSSPLDLSPAAISVCERIYRVRSYSCDGRIRDRAGRSRCPAHGTVAPRAGAGGRYQPALRNHLRFRERRAPQRPHRHGIRCPAPRPGTPVGAGVDPGFLRAQQLRPEGLQLCGDQSRTPARMGQDRLRHLAHTAGGVREAHAGGCDGVGRSSRGNHRRGNPARGVHGQRVEQDLQRADRQHHIAVHEHHVCGAVCQRPA